MNSPDEMTLRTEKMSLFYINIYLTACRLSPLKGVVTCENPRDVWWNKKSKPCSACHQVVYFFVCFSCALHLTPKLLSLKMKVFIQWQTECL